VSPSLLQTTRFRIAFGIWFLVWSLLHFWVLYRAGFSPTLAFYDSGISNVLLAGASLLVAVTLQYYLPDKRRYTYLVGLCVSLTAVWVVVSRGIVTLLLAESTGYRLFFSQSLLIRCAAGFMVISCAALIAALWYTLQDRQETEKRKSEADSLAKEAELTALRQQLQPHFLFNSLNSINALVVSQPQKARIMIQQLSDFLRGTLRNDQKERASLEEELEHLQLYLEIEKVRFGHRLSSQILNETKGLQLPVMLLQPVVENAIKFGLYDTTETVTISIHAREENGYLILQVTNPFDAQTNSPQKGAGFGLRSVQRRLYLLFARQDLLITRTENSRFITTIKIPQP
jgi:sensor histidine kinase YesM